MPGVQISTAVRTGPTSTTVRESSQAFFVGIAQRGPTNTAVKVSSMEEYTLVYGDYVANAYLHSTVEAFFEEGGSQCYIARAINANATTGFLVLSDTAPYGAVRLDAIGDGAWSDNLDAQVVAGSIANSVIVKLYYEDALIFTSGNCTTNAQIIGKINNSLIASKYVVASAGNALAGLITTISQTAFDGGANGTTPTEADCETALGLFLDSYGSGAVACPEHTGTASSVGTVPAALITHANANNRIAILHTDDGQTAANAQDAAEYITGTVVDNLEHVAIYYPWVYAPSGTPGVNRLIPPDGYVAGARARAHNNIGQHQPGAGIISTTRHINGIETEIGKISADTLDEAKVNVIRFINNSIRIYGARSLSGDTENFRYISAQDVVNHVVVEAERALEDILFSVIDGRGRIFAEVEARLIGILEPLRLNGALYEAFDQLGNRVDYGYTVKCNASLNPIANLANGTITARVGLRVSGIGDSIEVSIVKSNLTTSVV
jgi:hypothetical protein